MNRKHLVFIVNPNAGVKKRKAIRSAISNYLDHNIYSHEIVQTRFPNHGIELARQAAKDGAYAVIAVGGDGSINDIVSGLLGTDVILGIIPKGSGNGMARTMNIPLKDKEAIEVLNKGKVVGMDVGYANDILFVSNAGVAFDALISRKLAKSETRGIISYAWLVTRYMWTYKEWDWDITIDGEKLKKKAFIVNIANGKQFGYNFKIAPEANYTDGLFDVVVLRKFPKYLGAAMVLRVMNGTIHKSPYADHFHAKNITISNPQLRLLQTDGDAHYIDNEVTFSIKHGAQKVIVP